MNNSLMYAFVMTIAGIGIPVMAALNGGLGVRLQSPPLAAVILFLIALLVAVAYWLVSEGLPSSFYHSGIPWYFYVGGFFVALYVLSITWVAPRFGVSSAVSFALLGQLIAISAIDHFGLMGTEQYSLNMQRLMGLVLMALGIFMVLNKTPEL